MITEDAEHSINALLNLPAKGDEQDWDIELADGNRIKEFINAFHENDLDISEKYALVLLILASYDDYLEVENDVDGKIWLEIIGILEGNRGTYNKVLNYWAFWGTHQNHWFNITPLVRLYISNYSIPHE